MNIDHEMHCLKDMLVSFDALPDLRARKRALDYLCSRFNDELRQSPDALAETRIG